MLSKENRDRIILTGLYRHKPDKHKCYGSNLYHCKNWTFKPHKYQDRIYMDDTYLSSWGGLSYELTDDNIDEFEFVFDFTNVRRIRDDEANEYEDNNVYRVATDSGGYICCDNLYWVDKDAKCSREKLLNKKVYEISSLQRKLKYAEDELERIRDGTHYKLK